MQEDSYIYVLSFWCILHLNLCNFILLKYNIFFREKLVFYAHLHFFPPSPYISAFFNLKQKQPQPTGTKCGSYYIDHIVTILAWKVNKRYYYNRIFSGLRKREQDKWPMLTVPYYCRNRIQSVCITYIWSR